MAYNAGAQDGNQTTIGESMAVGAGGISTVGQVEGGTIEGGVGFANQVVLEGAGSGSPVQVIAQGSDATIGINLVPKGNGALGITVPVATVATAGVIVPTDFVGFLELSLNGTIVKIPYYSV